MSIDEILNKYRLFFTRFPENFHIKEIYHFVKNPQSLRFSALRRASGADYDFIQYALCLFEIYNKNLFTELCENIPMRLYNFAFYPLFRQHFIQSVFCAYFTYF